MQRLDIFIVEDEALIRMMLVEMLDELKHRVVAEAGSIEAARTLAETTAFELAILDINVRGRNIDPIAEIVQRRGLPFLFMTGYANSALPVDLADRPYLQKPCSLDRLREAIGSVLNFAP
jgi:DNA-binding NtrC family response regulator